MASETDTAAKPAKPAPTAAAAKASSRRRGLFTVLGAVVVIVAIVYGAFWVLVGSHHVKTDDAYVQADVADVTPLVSGAVIAAPAGDTKQVKKGDILVQLDPADFRLALAEAQANLGQAQRKVIGYFANSDAQAATTAARAADLSRAKSDLERARTDLERRKALAPSGAVSRDELTSAQNRFDEAQAGLALAQANASAAAGQQRVAGALIAGTNVADNPEVAVAKAKVDQAQLDLDRTVIRAPVDGVIAKNVVEVGQRVAAGTPVMTVVPIQTAYVDANFKEVQLRKVRLGQAVILTSDLYGGGVKFHGHVTGLAGGTGSSFAVIPAQNATGNWIKVVQRVPVRVALDPDELAKHPLRVGMSMNVDIDTAH
jgi:membrane fusion protein (multidrug efflux system)